LCGKRIDARDKTEYTKRYMELHPERKDNLRKWVKSHTKEHSSKTHLDLKRKVFAIISQSTEPKCISCGCNDIRLLEVNHINGGGAVEYRARGNSINFYRDIVALRRNTDGLEVLCRVCNAKHYLELKYGKLPIEVKWNGI